MYTDVGTPYATHVAAEVPILQGKKKPLRLEINQRNCTKIDTRFVLAKTVGGSGGIYSYAIGHVGVEAHVNHITSDTYEVDEKKYLHKNFVYKNCHIQEASNHIIKSVF